MALVRNTDWVRLLLAEDNDAFNLKALHEPPNLENADLRMLDLRRIDLHRANLRGAYLRNADLRGLDLSLAHLDGASLHEARVAGCLFPGNLSAQEISLSVTLGTRMRTRPA